MNNGCKVVKFVISVLLCVFSLSCNFKDDKVIEEDEKIEFTLDPNNWTEVNSSNSQLGGRFSAELLIKNSMVYEIQSNLLYLYEVRDTFDVKGYSVYQVSLKEVYKIEINMPDRIVTTLKVYAPIWYRFIPYMTVIRNVEGLFEEYRNLVDLQIKLEDGYEAGGWVVRSDFNSDINLKIDSPVFSKEDLKKICNEEDIDKVTAGFFSGSSFLGKKIWFFDGTDDRRDLAINMDYKEDPLGINLTVIRDLRIPVVVDYFNRSIPFSVFWTSAVDIDIGYGGVAYEFDECVLWYIYAHSMANKSVVEVLEYY